MSTTEGAIAEAPITEPRGRWLDARFAKWLVMINGAVPAALLAWDAYYQQLGANEVNFVIHTTGLVGLVFLVLSLLVTPLRRLTGWNLLIAVRRNLGVLGAVYLALHFAVFFAFDREASVSSTLHEIVERVYLWYGAAALVMLIPLAVTSTDRMVRRLGARRWKLLHRLSYPIAICGSIHYILLVKSDTRQPIAFAIAIGILLAYRIVRHYVDLRAEVRTARAKLAKLAGPSRAPAARPRRKFWSGELVVARIFDETHDVKTFRLVAAGGGPLPFDYVAGQYLNLSLTIAGKRVHRSYTLASSPTRGNYCEISVKRIGHGYASHHLHDSLREGSVLKVSAPAGHFVFDREAGREAERESGRESGPDAGRDPGAGHDSGATPARCVLIAGGVGITPLMSIVRSLTDRSWPGDIYLLFAVRTQRDIIFREELDYLQARFPNLHVHVTLSEEPDSEWNGARGMINRAMIERFVPGLNRGPILVCGPDPMMTAIRRLLVDDMGIADADVLQEAFVSPPSSSDDAPAEASGAALPDAAALLAPAAQTEPAAGAIVRFQRTGKIADLGSELTVLEAAEDAGVVIPFECRSGICGQCKTHLISGTVKMEVQDALTPSDRAQRLILACQARAVGDIVIDA
jgi:ferredoxin-NADP reductase/DMSO/TMAO reductase YedYZ heme-binding membrane subunit